jgi:CHAD domain-containing protein
MRPLLTTVREFILVGDERGPQADVPRIDDPRFSMTAGRKSPTLSRTWLDTFDWRLFRAGLTLELLSERGTSELVLTGRDGELVATELTTSSSSLPARSGQRIRWPSLIEDLPVGPLRERLAPVVGVRALLPVTKATSVRHELRALNSDEKTVAVLTVDQMSIASPQHGQPPARVTVIPLRGYQAQASKLADLLENSEGVAPATQSPFEAALAAAGRRPGDYTSKIDVQLSEEMPVVLALATVLQRLFSAVEVNLSGTIGDIDTEFLHDLRVAVRRTRSVLKTAQSVLPASFIAHYRPEFKWLGDLTTPTRDLDVYLLGYPSMAARLVAATPHELTPFRLHLEQQRAVAYRQLARGLRSARFRSLASSWRHDLDNLLASPGRKPVTGPFAGRRTGKKHQQVLTAGSVIGPTSPPQSLHDLRKQCKELRYLLEVFASLHDPAEQWRAVNELKSLQDCLGEFQDTEVQITELRAFATQMMAAGSAPAETLLAMGEIAATLAVRQGKARAEFAGRFAEFASPRGQARVGALAESAVTRNTQTKNTETKNTQSKNTLTKVTP